MFSYAEYTEIIHLIKATGLAADYHRALTSGRFIIMRHDVEFSVERAFALSRIESGLDFTADYFFQWTNNNYNILSRRHTEMIRDMSARGHRIGLHFALNGLTDMEEIRRQIRKEVDILSEMFGFPVRQFSIHRPSAEVLQANIKYPDIINAYQEEFFTYSPDAANAPHLPIKYLSDANHIWRYGYPDAATIGSHERLQILTHPFAWTEKGYDNFHNYQSLIGEKHREMIDSIDTECKDFNEYREYFMNKCEEDS
ncbi:MAG: hypothetical protein LBI54_06375 [Lachnospiraceae bacterium]|jgi:hypothetical protein|nr:hypothetical protein [Lachnospiraceae bacterium]